VQFGDQGIVDRIALFGAVQAQMDDGSIDGHLQKAQRGQGRGGWNRVGLHAGKQMTKSARILPEYLKDVNKMDRHSRGA
jgi:hypothetical protein